MTTRIESLENILSELQSLGKKQPLKGNDLQRAKELMAMLKKSGYTNKQVSELSGDAWSQHTIKLYTRGVRSSHNNNSSFSSSKQSAERTISNMVTRGLSLGQVESIVSLKDELESKGLTLENISFLINEAQKANLDIQGLLQFYNNIKDTGLTIAQLSDSLKYKTELERLGITINDLNKVIEKSKKYGSISKVIQALDDFPTIETIQQQISTMYSQKEDLRNHIELLKEEIKKLEDQRSQIKDILDLYNELKQLGLNGSMLQRIKEASSKYGRMENILEAILAYDNLTEIRAHADAFENKISNAKTKLDKINADYAHFQTLIDMCNTLLYDYKFNIPAINEIYGMAKKYGKPFEVIKAVAKYGELQDLENIVNELSKQRNNLESRIKILENRTHELEGQAETIKESVNGLLQPISSELKQTLSGAMESLTSTYKQQIDIIRKDTEEYAKRLGQSAVFEEELKLARLLRGMIKYPTDMAANNLPIDYAILLIGAVSNFCRAKKINPKSKAGEDINKKYSNMLSFLEVEVLDLLDWTKRALESSM